MQHRRNRLALAASLGLGSLISAPGMELPDISGAQTPVKPPTVPSAAQVLSPLQRDKTAERAAQATHQARRQRQR